MGRMRGQLIKSNPSITYIPRQKSADEVSLLGNLYPPLHLWGIYLSICMYVLYKIVLVILYTPPPSPCLYSFSLSLFILAVGFSFAHSDDQSSKQRHLVFNLFCIIICFPSSDVKGEKVVSIQNFPKL
uniref:Uncharacterized protein n=1 Tax=Cacopsylla melanoneura TaxID=428564 RepID=A0A8D8TJ72_9HEMI